MEFVGLFLDKENAEPLYAQLYNYFIGAIRTGRLASGEKLPGKRSAAAQLGVSVNTVDTAYQMLAAEGYIFAKPRSGFAVCRLEQLVPPPAASVFSVASPAGLPATTASATPQQSPPKTKWPGSMTPSFAAARPAVGEIQAPSLSAPAGSAGTHWRYSFASGGIDLGLFPYKTWRRISREVLVSESDLFSQGEAMGDDALRQAIADYLHGYRGVHCAADQLVVGAGLEVLIGMLARLFPSVKVAVEDPGYPKTLHIFRNNGLPILPLPLDEQGMPLATLIKSKAQIAYLTPSHQFPTGAVMPVGRRIELLGWAANKDRLIIEDDYDSEFRFDGRPLPCLQGLDENGQVVYAGTFSRSLAPGLRVAYLVLPISVRKKWSAAYGDYACTVSRPEQHTLAKFMAEGHFARSLNRMRATYKVRRGLLLDVLRLSLPSPRYNYHIENAHTGLYFILRLPGIDAVSLAATARKEGIGIRALDEYRADTKYPTNHQSATADALVVGYGGLANGEVEPAVKALFQVILAAKNIFK